MIIDASCVTFKELRQRSGLTQAELAKKLGVRMQFISNIERDVAVLPINMINRCARIFKRDPEIFIRMNVDRHEALVRKKIKSQK